MSPLSHLLNMTLARIMIATMRAMISANSITMGTMAIRAPISMATVR
jgi:hypothetical protein